MNKIPTLVFENIVRYLKLRDVIALSRTSVNLQHQYKRSLYGRQFETFKIQNYTCIETIFNRISMAESMIKLESKKKQLVYLAEVCIKKNSHYLCDILAGQSLDMWIYEKLAKMAIKGGNGEFFKAHVNFLSEKSLDLFTYEQLALLAIQYHNIEFFERHPLPKYTDNQIFNIAILHLRTVLFRKIYSVGTSEYLKFMNNT